MAIPKLYAWTRWLSFRVFLLAFVVTLIGMSLLGRWCSQQNPYQNFVRFHELLHPESLYYPTISQLKGIVKEQLQDRDKIGVVVGGSSIFNGVGQTPDQLWTKHLQEILGDRYRVINLALRGGWVFGGGAIAAESLLEEGYKIIYTADTVLGHITPAEAGYVYNYFFWDALYKGLIKNYPPRHQEMQKQLTINPDYSELKIRLWLDSIFYFHDLWTTVGYRYFFTVWNALIAGNSPTAFFMQPRAQTVDPETRYKLKPSPERYQILEQSNQGLVKNSHHDIATWCRQVYDRQQSDQQQSDQQQSEWITWQLWLDLLIHRAKIIFPESFRSHTLLVMTYRSPYYFETMEPRYRDCWEKGNELFIEQLQKVGYWATEAGRDFLAEDYRDLLHLAPSGGVKTAEIIAPQIQQIAASHGYLQ